MPVVEFLYALCVVLLSIYGFNSLVLTWLYLRHPHAPPLRQPSGRTSPFNCPSATALNYAAGG